MSGSLLMVLLLLTTDADCTQDASLSIQPMSSDVLVGGTCNISCEVPNKNTKYGPPIISWYKHSDGNINLQKHTKYIVINATTVQHSGAYYCAVRDDNGQMLRSPFSVVHVRTPLVIESVSPEPGTSYKLEDFQANITISGTDRKGSYYLHYISDSGTTFDTKLGLNLKVLVKEVYGAYSFGQKKAFLISILPLTNLHTFCNLPRPVYGSFILAVKHTWSGNTYSIMNFTVGVNDPIILKRLHHDFYALVGTHNISVTFKGCIRANVKTTWKLNGAVIPNDVVIDHNGIGILIPEVQDHHFGLYRLTALNVNNRRIKTRTFRICNKTCPPEAPQQTLDAEDKFAYIIAPVVIIMVVLLVGGYVFKKYKDRTGRNNSSCNIDDEGYLKSTCSRGACDCTPKEGGVFILETTLKEIASRDGMELTLREQPAPYAAEGVCAQTAMLERGAPVPKSPQYKKRIEFSDSIPTRSKVGYAETSGKDLRGCYDKIPDEPDNKVKEVEVNDGVYEEVEDLDEVCKLSQL